jgi:protein gp37
MSDRTSIEWTDATVNFWWGCTKVGPGCDHCYAEALDRRFGGEHWGAGRPRRKIKGAVAALHRLDNAYADWAADHECAAGNARAFGLPHPGTQIRRRVFIQSMSDLFDTEAPLEWFREAWNTMEGCNRLTLQILTKRVSAVEKRLAAIGRTRWPGHAGLMITVVNQPEADRDVPRLLVLKEKLGIPWIGLSIEPMLGPVDLDFLETETHRYSALIGQTCERVPVGTPGSNNGLRVINPFGPRLDWVVLGGESGPGARPMQEAWAESLRDQCRAAGVAFFMKQMTKKAPIPERLMIREFPDAR